LQLQIHPNATRARGALDALLRQAEPGAGAAGGERRANTAGITRRAMQGKGKLAGRNARVKHGKKSYRYGIFGMELMRRLGRPVETRGSGSGEPPAGCGFVSPYCRSL